MNYIDEFGKMFESGATYASLQAALNKAAEAAKRKDMDAPYVQCANTIANALADLCGKEVPEVKELVQSMRSEATIAEIVKELKGVLAMAKVVQRKMPPDPIAEFLVRNHL